MPRMPTIFMPHGGGPCFFMDWNPPGTWDKQAAYLRGLPGAVGQRPDAILIISGHWEEDAATVLTSPQPELLFDYYGFPPHTYELEYPAPGDPRLAAQVTDLLERAGIPTGADAKRGFDHGVFIPLKVAFPVADIPVVQLSLMAGLDPAAHIAVGEELQPLRDEGVLILGSGNSYHNIGVMMAAMHDGGGSGDGPLAGQVFDRWLSDAACNPDPDVRNQMLADWASASEASDSHPREEHLLPLHVVAGAAGSDIGVKTLEDPVMGAIQSAFQFG